MTRTHLESFKRGIQEMVYEPQAEWITSQIELLSENLVTIPHYRGADGIYIQSDKFLPQLSKDQAHALSALFFLKAGFRCVVQGKYEGATVVGRAT